MNANAKRLCILVCACTVIALFAHQTAACAEGVTMLWEIGKADNDTKEFLLAPGGYASFKNDPTYMIGISDPGEDWPYAHPGPGDSWAGGRQHSFVILFALDKVAKKGTCRFQLDLVDTHASSPPKLCISVNGNEMFRDLNPGFFDDSIFGDPTKGQEQRVTVEFPVTHLKQGNNEIRITTVSGSWLLYDWLGLETPKRTKLANLQTETRVSGVESVPLLVERDGALHQTIRVHLNHVGTPQEATLQIADAAPVALSLAAGAHTIEASVRAVEQETTVPVVVRVGDALIAQQDQVLKPVRKWVVCLLHHTHLDIGYTHLQTDVEKRQWEHLELAIELARKTADYPEGAQFKWLPEGLWAIDSYLKQASPEKRDAFIDAVKKGWIDLDALYGNELTALCRPEELIRLTDCARRMEALTGVPIDSAMITDVPGYTWGMVPTLAQAGIKYFSIGPNAGHRIGFTLSEWGDKPFYWVSPSGEEKVLCWVAGKAYSWFHRGPIQNGDGIVEYLSQLEAAAYPYEMVHVRYNIGGDNGPPDPSLPEFVKEWNAKYAYPKLVITTNSDMFREFEERYADIIPSFSGDFTPYWEDGAASSALETVVNREAAERLVQAETLFAMLRPDKYPAEDFYQAWRNVLLYDEHTWGAHNSITEPEVDFVKGQWAIKQAFALDADKQSRQLIDAAVPTAKHGETVRAVQVFNTCSWQRSEFVFLPKEWARAGDRVRDAKGDLVPSQRLTTGELVFPAHVPPFGASTFTFEEGPPYVVTEIPPGVDAIHEAEAKECELSNLGLILKVDPATGAIASLGFEVGDTEFINTQSGMGLNEYFYVAGRDPKEPQRAGAPTIRVKETGPLVASLVVESDAPGCNKLTREIRLLAWPNRIDIIDTLDKKNVYEQEAVHIAFPFNVPNGVMRINVPWGVVRPEADQLPGACKNYFTVQRWVDVSNEEYGVTCAIVDAPLIEVGAITNDPRIVRWIEHLDPTQTFYSYVMNNYWETNYKASQEGPTTFRYSINPHSTFYPSEAEKFGVECSQPLVVVPVDPKTPEVPSLFTVTPDHLVLVSAFKPSEDGKAWIVRLYGASDQPVKATLAWNTAKQPEMFLSNLKEEQLSRIEGPIDVPAYGMVTVRIPR